MGVRFPAGAGIIPPLHRVKTGTGSHPASYPMGTAGSFPKNKQRGNGSDHPPPSSAEVKNVWRYTYTPPICLHDVLLLALPLQTARL
jgi:hypothetical protein